MALIRSPLTEVEKEWGGGSSLSNGALVGSKGGTALSKTKKKQTIKIWEKEGTTRRKKKGKGKRVDCWEEKRGGDGLQERADRKKKKGREG